MLTVSKDCCFCATFAFTNFGVVFTLNWCCCFNLTEMSFNSQRTQRDYCQTCCMHLYFAWWDELWPVSLPEKGKTGSHQLYRLQVRWMGDGANVTLYFKLWVWFIHTWCTYFLQKCPLFQGLALELHTRCPNICIWSQIKATASSGAQCSINTETFKLCF